MRAHWPSCPLVGENDAYNFLARGLFRKWFRMFEIIGNYWLGLHCHGRNCSGCRADVAYLSQAKPFDVTNVGISNGKVPLSGNKQHMHLSSLDRERELRPTGLKAALG